MRGGEEREEGGREKGGIEGTVETEEVERG